MAEQPPSKNDITAIFKRLRSIQTNKVCFDCNAKNPTWASVTYGVFICIDCSAVHRSLGVHLSFVRSTNLDTNWTWLQLRAMQVGSNSNAVSFFRQHNCTSTDSQQKYNSRAAQLYREKLHHLAVTAMRTHGTKLHLETCHEPSSPEQKEVDFFEAHVEGENQAENNANNNSEVFANGMPALAALCKPIPLIKNGGAGDASGSDLAGPNVEAALSTSPTEAQKHLEARKPTIGSRKPAQPKKGMGARKGGLGAQKVSANFGEIEKEAQQREQAVAEEKERYKMTKEEEEKNFASMRLAYQDLSVQQQKEENRLKQHNPNKASQLERLGMGFAGRTSATHSAMSEMKTIEQESPNKGPSSSTFGGGGGGGGSGRSSKERDFFEDEYEFVGFTPGPPKYGDSPFSRDDRSIYGLYTSKSSQSVSVEEKYGVNRSSSWHTDKTEKKMFMEDSVVSKDNNESGRSRRSYQSSNASTGNEAVKKFGNAKAISSEQFFGGSRDSDYERKANLSRFEGSNSISSADYFGDSSQQHHRVSSSASASYNGPDLDDIKEGVRAGVTKVAGKLSSLANGVMNSLQDRYN